MYIASIVWVCELCIGIHSSKIYLGSLLIVNNPLQTKTAYVILQSNIKQDTIIILNKRLIKCVSGYRSKCDVSGVVHLAAVRDNECAKFWCPCPTAFVN
jgi:hypothetical protein